MKTLPRYSLHLLARVVAIALSGLLAASPAGAACPAGQSNPITSGSPGGRSPVIVSVHGNAPIASFFALGAERRAHSGALPPSAWLVNLGDLDGDGFSEFRVDAPGEGPGGWGDPLTVGCPSTLVPPRPPLVLEIRHESEDLDGDGKFDIYEDTVIRNGRLDPGEDRDGDGRLTPPDGCEGEAREDVDCDGHVDRFWEDLNLNGHLDPGEDYDGDRRLDYIDEDRNHNGIMDPGEDRNENGHLDTRDAEFAQRFPLIFPYIEDRNEDQVLNDRTTPRPDDLIFEGPFTGGPRPQLPASYPYGSFVPAPGGMITAIVAWNGTAYNLESMAASTRLIASPGDFDAKKFPNR
jgi:hypothetical protein